jgi:hypothetical protein
MTRRQASVLPIVFSDIAEAPLSAMRSTLVLSLFDVYLEIGDELVNGLSAFVLHQDFMGQIAA